MLDGQIIGDIGATLWSASIIATTRKDGTVVNVALSLDAT